MSVLALKVLADSAAPVPRFPSEELADQALSWAQDLVRERPLSAEARRAEVAASNLRANIAMDFDPAKALANYRRDICLY